MKYSLQAIAAAVVSVALVSLFAGSVSASPEPTGPDGGAAGAEWTAAADGPQQYPNIYIEWDIAIPLSDGVVLKANLYRPADTAGRPIETPTPTIVNLTPYTKLVTNVLDSASSVPGVSDALLRLARQIDLTGTPISGLTDITKALGNGEIRNFAVDRQLIKSGYTQLVVDVRGTGFSQGEWDMLRAREQQDTVEVIDWAASQPWSNGSIGMSGISYSGINQLQVAEKHPPALKAIFPIVAGSDLVNDVLAPGGGFGISFIPAWLMTVNGTKLVPDLASVFAGTFDMQWLADRVKDPITYMDVLLNAYTVTKVDDLDPRAKELLDASSVTRQNWLGDPSNIHVPAFMVGGWHDLFTYSESKIYNAIPLPPGQKQLLMGNTYHFISGSESGRSGLPPRVDVLQRAWFDKWLKGIDNGIDRYGPLTLRQQGGNWTSTDAFAEPTETHIGPRYRRMYLSANSSGTARAVYDGSLLSQAGPDRARLTVAPGLTTICSNDAAQATLGLVSVLDACGKGSRIAELGALTFTSDPVVADTTISGRIAIRLNTVQDASDGYWAVTLNDVAPDGQSSVLSSGQLLASLREIDEKLSSRSANGDYTDPRPYLSLDHRRPTSPGEQTTLDITLTASEAVLRPGHRLRVDVYAADLPKALPPLPFLVDTGLKPQHLQLDPDRPSFVNVPITGDPGW